MSDTTYEYKGSVEVKDRFKMVYFNFNNRSYSTVAFKDEDVDEAIQSKIRSLRGETKCITAQDK